MSIDSPIAITSTGAVRGRSEGDVAVFRGIPFAQPPIGAARFAAPRPAASWSGVRDAFEFGPEPPQMPLGPFASSGSKGATDWLTVNVWTPVADTFAHLSVLVWIYGGAYALGSSAGAVYDGARLAREHDVVVVTFNYRLGMEGFAQLHDAPANRGLLDQVAALRWVQDNVAAFGGDPDQVTVFGESAGAGSIAALMAMPSAKGLFQRAIVQSLPGTYFSSELAEDIAGALVAPLGLAPTADEVAKVDPYTLAETSAALLPRMATYADRWGAVAHTITPFSPVVDGEILPQTPWEALAAGTRRDVPVIIGHTRDEYRRFLVMSGQYGKITDEQASVALKAFGPGHEAESAYRSTFPDATPEYLFELVQSDWAFRMPALHLAQAHIAGGGQAHVYELTWPAPAKQGLFGACHGLDVPLTFGQYGGEADLFGLASSPEAEAVSTQIRSAWTAFAKAESPGWPVYDTHQRLVRVFDTQPSITAYLEEASRRMWQQHTFDALPLQRVPSGAPDAQAS